MKYLLDASAALAPLLDEPGADQVVLLGGDAGITAVNLAEVVARLIKVGRTALQVNEALVILALPVLTVEEADGRSAGLLSKLTADYGLSLGDRVCLAVARRKGLTAVTADRAWQNVAARLGVEIYTIR